MISTSTETTLREFFAKSYLPNKRSMSAPESAHDYETAFRQYQAFLGREPRISDLNSESLNAWLNWLVDAPMHGRTGRSRAPATLNKRRASLLTLWRHAMKKKVLPFEMPDCEPFPNPRKKPVAWTADEVNLILETALTLEGNIPQKDIAARFYWFCLPSFLLQTALRINAAMSLHPSDFNLETGQAVIRAETQKHKREQIVEVSPRLLSVMVKHLNIGKYDRVFPWPFSRAVLRSHYRRILIAAGLPHGPEWLFHALRKTCCTIVSQEATPEDAQRVADHSTIAMTRMHYIDPTKGDIRPAHQYMPTLPAFGLVEPEPKRNGKKRKKKKRKKE